MNQENAFLSGEGNAWFARNQSALKSNEVKDFISPLVDQAQVSSQLRRILDLGCSNGWLLQRFFTRLALGGVVGIEAVGYDISVDSIRDGSKSYPDLLLRCGSASSMGFDERNFDLVILNFVLHWIDRSLLSQVVRNVDLAVRDGGYLAIADFNPALPCRRRYKHRCDVELFTYKQNYVGIFTGLGTYETVSAIDFNADTGKVIVDGACEDQSRARSALLRKSLDHFYPLEP